MIDSDNTSMTSPSTTDVENPKKITIESHNVGLEESWSEFESVSVYGSSTSESEEDSTGISKKTLHKRFEYYKAFLLSSLSQRYVKMKIIIRILVQAAVDFLQKSIVPIAFCCIIFIVFYDAISKINIIQSEMKQDILLGGSWVDNFRACKDYANFDHPKNAAHEVICYHNGGICMELSADHSQGVLKRHRGTFEFMLPDTKGQSHCVMKFSECKPDSKNKELLSCVPLVDSTCSEYWNHYTYPQNAHLFYKLVSCPNY